MAEHDTTQLVERIRRDAKIPKGSTLYDAATLLRMADVETQAMVLQHVLRASGDYLVRYVDIPLVEGKRAYRLPSRAIRLKDVERLDSDGNNRDFSSVDSSQAKDFKGSGRHWHFEDNAVVPLLEPGATGFLRLRYYRWPSRLVLPAECGLVTGAASATAAALEASSNLGDVPTTLSVDVVKGTPGFESLGDAVEATISTLNQVELGTTLVSELELGDAVCPAGTTCFPQLPLAFHEVLVECVVSKVLKGGKDFDGAAAAAASVQVKAEAALVTVSPRSKTERTVVGRTWFR